MNSPMYLRGIITNQLSLGMKLNGNCTYRLQRALGNKAISLRVCPEGFDQVQLRMPHGAEGVGRVDANRRPDQRKTQ
jgi:hypothetical protein